MKSIDRETTGKGTKIVKSIDRETTGIHLNYETLFDLMADEMEVDDAERSVRIVRYALELGALARLRDYRDSQTAREILLIADALAEDEDSPRLIEALRAY